MLILIIAFCLSFIITYLSLPYAIEKLQSAGHIIIDRYKPEKPEIPTHGSIVIFFTVVLVCAILPLLSRVLSRLHLESDYTMIDEVDIAILLVISMFGLFGVIDDLIDIGWWSKVILPFCFSFPLLMVFSPETVFIPIYGKFSLSHELGLGIYYSDVFKVTIIPIYIMVIANLVNMHSGFNGLQSGLSAILLSTIIK